MNRYLGVPWNRLRWCVFVIEQVFGRLLGKGMLRIFWLVLLCWAAQVYVVWAQNTREVELEKQRKEIEAKDQRLTRKHGDSNRPNRPVGIRRESIKEYKKRVLRRRKEYEAAIRERDADPRYTDPEYFGHKKKPEKRPVGKKKYCEECGIVH
ncbi:MAG: hypothetical protein OXB93_00780 [Cytophagales bacterium]|nr:hypothetical protein [Cytophagales bacterium]